MTPGSAVPSPCIAVCRMDRSDGLCVGCRRTLEEIAHWPEMDDDGRRAVLAQLAQRPPAPPRPARTVS